MVDHSPFSGCGWTCFGIIVVIDSLLIFGFLLWQGAVPSFWNDPDSIFFESPVQQNLPAGQDVPPHPPSSPVAAPPPPYGSATMTGPQWLYFCIECFCNFTVALICISLCGAYLHRIRYKRRLTTQMAPESERRVSYVTGVTVLLPCYMPNEKAILPATVQHIIEKIEYPQPFDLILCYNSPKPVEPAESEWAALNGHVYENGRTLRVMKIEGSKSKAENLNAALDAVDTENVMIYDADHHADADSLMIATEFMKVKDCKCVQGSTYIRYKPNFLAKLIDAEFFVIFFCFFPATQFLSKVGIFGGSNALWKTDVLKKYKFRHDVQTEDVDLSTRVGKDQVKIRFCPESRSGELPPANFAALWKQRLRWEIGWDQVSLQHMASIRKSKLPVLRKLALYYWLPWRWLMLTTSAINAAVTPLVVFTCDVNEFGLPLRIMLEMAFISVIIIDSFVLINAFLIARPSEWIPIILFQLVGGIFYLLWNGAIVATSLFKIATGQVRGQGFTPTERGHAGAKTSAKASPAVVATVEVEDVAPESGDAEQSASGATDPASERRSRVVSVPAVETAEARARAASAFGYAFAASEDLGVVDKMVPEPSTPKPIEVSMQLAEASSAPAASHDLHV